MDTDQTRTAARRVLEEVFPADDEVALAELISPDFVNHESPPGTPRGLEGITFYMHMLARAFSDQAWTMEQVVCDGDMVAMYCTHSGRHTGDFFGVPPTGRTFSYKQMHLVRMANGMWITYAAMIKRMTTYP